MEKRESAAKDAITDNPSLSVSLDREHTKMCQRLLMTFPTTTFIYSFLSCSVLNSCWHWGLLYFQHLSDACCLPWLLLAQTYQLTDFETVDGLPTAHLYLELKETLHCLVLLELLSMGFGLLCSCDDCFYVGVRKIQKLCFYPCCHLPWISPIFFKV